MKQSGQTGDDVIIGTGFDIYKKEKESRGKKYHV